MDDDDEQQEPVSPVEESMFLLHPLLSPLPLLFILRVKTSVSHSDHDFSQTTYQTHSVSLPDLFFLLRRLQGSLWIETRREMSSW